MARSRVRARDDDGLDAEIDDIATVWAAQTLDAGISRQPTGSITVS